MPTEAPDPGQESALRRCLTCAHYETAPPAVAVDRRCLWASRTARPVWADRPAVYFMPPMSGAGCPAWTARPARIQRARRKGWRMPPGVISVCRGGPWGNPMAVTFRNRHAPTPWFCGGSPPAPAIDRYFPTEQEARLHAVHWFREHVAPRLDLAPLRGKILACWCPLGQACHADVLLELANA